MDSVEFEPVMLMLVTLPALACTVSMTLAMLVAVSLKPMELTWGLTKVAASVLAVTPEMAKV